MGNGAALHRVCGGNVARLLQGQAVIHLGIRAIRQFFGNARQMGYRGTRLADSHQRGAQFALHQRIARRCFQHRPQMEQGTVGPSGTAPKPSNGAVQALPSASGKRCRNHHLRGFSLRRQQHIHQIDGGTHIARALAQRLTIRRLSARAITRKSQGLTLVIVDLRRIRTKRDGAIE